MANRWLIVGLGNPGSEYVNTRHNIGALVVERMATQSQAKFSAHKARADIAEIRLGVGGETPVLILARPRSFMNESGGPVKALADYFSISPDQIIVLHDELDIDFNSIRVKLGGGDNGHNGLKVLLNRWEVVSITESEWELVDHKASKTQPTLC